MNDIRKELGLAVKELEKLRSKLEKAIIEVDKQQGTKTAMKPARRKAPKKTKKKA